MKVGDLDVRPNANQLDISIEQTGSSGRGRCQVVGVCRVPSLFHHRAISAVQNKEKLSKWWGKDDWIDLKEKSSWEIADIVRKRFQEELGYRFAAAYPIFDKNAKGKVMYYMIHALDHEEAPALMVRAHHKAVRALPREVQGALPLTVGGPDITLKSFAGGPGA
jgi:hypothetical protein